MQLRERHLLRHRAARVRGQTLDPETGGSPLHRGTDEVRLSFRDRLADRGGLATLLTRLLAESGVAARHQRASDSADADLLRGLPRPEVGLVPLWDEDRVQHLLPDRRHRLLDAFLRRHRGEPSDALGCSSQAAASLHGHREFRARLLQLARAQGRALDLAAPHQTLECRQLESVDRVLGSEFDQASRPRVVGDVRTQRRCGLWEAEFLRLRDLLPVDVKPVVVCALRRGGVEGGRHQERRLRVPRCQRREAVRNHSRGRARHLSGLDEEASARSALRLARVRWVVNVAAGDVVLTTQQAECPDRPDPTSDLAASETRLLGLLVFPSLEFVPVRLVVEFPSPSRFSLLPDVAANVLAASKRPRGNARAHLLERDRLLVEEPARHRDGLRELVLLPLVPLQPLHRLVVAVVVRLRVEVGELRRTLVVRREHRRAVLVVDPLDAADLPIKHLRQGVLARARANRLRRLIAPDRVLLLELLAVEPAVRVRGDPVLHLGDDDLVELDSAVDRWVHRSPRLKGAA